jgi:DNA-binding transcriptional ArsR family regulator
VNTQCTICRHPKRKEIEDALVRCVPMRRIARRYGVSKSAVGRHILSHVAEELLEMMRERVEAQGAAKRGLPPAMKEWLRIERDRTETLLRIERERVETLLKTEREREASR